MSKKATSYTLDEQLACQVARTFDPDDKVMVRGLHSFVSVGVALAQRLYAPKIAICLESKGKGALINNLRFPFVYGKIPEESIDALISMDDVFDAINAGKWFIFMQPVQVDKILRSNLSLLGDINKPSRVFVGSRGVPGNTINAVRTVYIVPRQTANTFVEKVDLVSGAGYGEEREKGMIKWGVPIKVITNMAIFDFDEKTKNIRLASVHTGVTVKQVVENTGIKLTMSDPVPETDAPTEEEIELLRKEIDPLGVRRLDLLGGDAYKEAMAEIQKGTPYPKL